jgi:Ala-tRNA(Pro) deacylase
MPEKTDPQALADGGAPATPEDLFRRLGELGIETSTMEHPAVFTVEEAREARGPIPGCHTKNLFLRDKKGRRMWLVVCREDRAVDLRQLALRVGASGRLSFGSAERLMKYLGVTPGAVNPFAVINDHGGAVRVVVDRAILDDPPLNFHPLVNTMTTSIGADDFLRFLSEEKHEPKLIDFGHLVT